jgi:hypothetical protein
LPGLAFLQYRLFMSSLDNPVKARRGRPRTDARPILVRVPSPVLDALDRWIAAQPDAKPSRAEAIRRLLAIGLAVGEGEISSKAEAAGGEPAGGRAPEGRRKPQPPLIANPDEVKGG